MKSLGRVRRWPSVEFTSLSNLQNLVTPMGEMIHRGHPTKVRIVKIYKDVDLTLDG